MKLAVFLVLFSLAGGRMCELLTVPAACMHACVVALCSLWQCDGVPILLWFNCTVLVLAQAAVAAALQMPGWQAAACWPDTISAAACC